MVCHVVEGIEVEVSKGSLALTLALTLAIFVTLPSRTVHVPKSRPITLAPTSSSGSIRPHTYQSQRTKVAYLNVSLRIHEEILGSYITVCHVECMKVLETCYDAGRVETNSFKIEPTQRTLREGLGED